MAKTLSAEIVGGGLAALVAATRLAMAGWHVRVHEKSAAVRDTGSGIYIWENGLRILEALGAYDMALEGAVAAKASRYRGPSGESVSRIPEDLQSRIRIYTVLRQPLLNALLTVAEKAGAEIVTNSEVVSVDARGSLTLANGDVREADLVVGADGVGSVVRECMGLTSVFEPMIDGSVRAMIPRLPEDGDDSSVEYWHGTRRILVTPVSASQIYLALTCLDTDIEGKSMPLNKPSWKRSFPELSSMIDRIETARWDRFIMVKTKAWSKGHVAVVGDAAHAMTPNLGQGGGMAMQNAFSLGTEMAAVSGPEEIPEALRRWEARERDLTEHTQTWAWLYGFLSTLPDDLRGQIIGASTNAPWVMQQRYRTALSIPYGSDELRTANKAGVA